MKNIFVLIILLSCLRVSAQISEGGMPYSYGSSSLKSLAILPEFKLKKLDIEKYKAEDAENPSPYRYSIIEDVNLNIKNGYSQNITDPKGTIWRYEITADSAYSIQIIMKTFVIPEGAKLFLYNSDYSIIYGAFTSKNIDADSTFTIADFPGKKVILEYFEPSEASFKGTVKIGSIGQAYRDINQFNSMNTEATDYIDINCDEGKLYQNEKHAVCKIVFRVANSGYLCTGTFINNTKNDGTPYFLTANHCIGDSAAAKTIVAYFNYEKKSCNGVTGTYKTLSGANLVTTGTKSDYALVRFNSVPSASYMPFYAGWDISDYKEGQNVCIHHPEGIEKKISIDFDKITTYNYQIQWDEGGVTPASTHWMVAFDEGATSGGSSGAPLFSRQKRILGQLHGGDNLEGFFGKLNYSWTNPATKYKTLKTYLDPTNSGVLTLDSYAPSTNPPDAFFSTPITTVCQNYTITLNDYSAFTPSSREWTISPSTFSFMNGTDKNSVNPQVAFNTAGTYTVKLNVNNSIGKDSLQINGYIAAGSTLNVDFESNRGNSLCYTGFDSLLLRGVGAESYTWSLKPQTIEPFYFSRISGDTAVLKSHSNVNVDSTYNLEVELIGTQGTCTNNIVKPLDFIKITNDDIEHAREIGLGTSTTYSNTCASIQTNEPIPPTGSCTGTTSWCDEYGDGTKIVENSVWFTFKGPASGKASLRSDGFDNEIAIYDATSYQAILTGNYTILAANDDESDVSPTPFIPEVTVTPGKTYWIQVDGSGGGSEGDFTLTLADRNTTGTDELDKTKSIEIYPVPVHNILTLKGSMINNEDVNVKIYSTIGKLCYENSYQTNGNEININAEGLAKGIYLLKLISGNKIYVTRFVKN